MKLYKIEGFKILSLKDESEFYENLILKKKLLLSLNPRKFIEKNKDLTDLFRKAFFLPDSFFSQVAVYKHYKTWIKKNPGCVFWLKILENLPQKKIYLIGTTPSNILKVHRKLKEEINEINIVGFTNGFFDGIESIIKDIKQKQPEIIIIGTAYPVQERLIYKLYSSHKAFYMGVGGSFDVYINLKKRPIKIFQNFGFEGIYYAIVYSFKGDFSKIKRLIIAFRAYIKLMLNF